jgi:hypothetical protein
MKGKHISEDLAWAIVCMAPLIGNEEMRPSLVSVNGRFDLFYPFGEAQAE